MFGNRIGLIVWMRSLKQVKILKKFGNVHYVSKKMKYVVLYCDADHVDEMINRLSSANYVKSVQKSLKPYIKTEFEDGKWDKAKQYDYKIGI
jgi:uncharacterized protein YlbG (UPF0298 family)